MAQNQRRAILQSIPPGGRMLEWGPGGTTRWLLERMKPGQRLTSVEHSEAWEGPIRDACRRFANWEFMFLPGPAGANATPAEECPVGLERYICPVAAATLPDFDVFLIDGVARGACLANVLINAKPGATVWLHDVQRNWYLWAVLAGQRRIERQTLIMPDAGDYPAKLWGCTIV